MISKNRITVLIIAICTIIIAWIAVTSFINRDNGSVKMVLAPAKMTLSYTGAKKTVSYGDVLSLHEGTYNFTFSRDGFESAKQTITVKKGEVQSVYVLLKALSDSANAEMQDDSNQNHKEEIVGHQINEGGKVIDKNNPILKILPILEKNYTISACSIPVGYKGPGDDKDVAVCIEALSDAAYNAAVKRVQDKGYKLEDYLVIRK